MDKQEVLYWSKKCDEEFLLSIEKEKSIGARLRQNNELTKADLIEIMKWKFEGDARRTTRELNLVADVDEQVLRNVSSVVFSLTMSQETYRIKLLDALDHGIGVAVASTILTFFDPDNYGVFDFHVWQEMFGEKLNGRYTTSNYGKLLSKLRQVAEEFNLKVRTVEKAFFKKDYDQSKNRRGSQD